MRDSKPVVGALAAPWSSEGTTMTRRPSWISPRRSSLPAPPSSIPAPVAAPPVVELLVPQVEGAVELERWPGREPSIAPQPLEDAIDAMALSSSVARLTEENAALRVQVAQMAGAMAGLRREVLEASEPELVSLALAIAQRVVARELRLDPTLILHWAHDAIQSLATKDEVIIALGRDVAKDLPEDARTLSGGVPIEVDPQLAPDACEVRAPGCTIAAGAEARVAAVAEVLGVKA
jgi:flagellar assembly protein FliH